MYIREAHPTDGWVLPMNAASGIEVKEPVNEKERGDVAGVCVRNLGIKFPALVDNLNNSVEQSYAGWPDRIYVIDADGRIFFKGRPGPSGFRPDELRASLEKIFPPAPQ